MAVWLNKWFFPSVFPLFVLAAGIQPGMNRAIMDASQVILHPFHVSVVEINHNKDDRNLEISCKVFTDDFEKLLTQKYKTKVDLLNPVDRGAMDKLIGDYIRVHLSIHADDKPLSLSYLGFERDGDAIYAYAEVPNIAEVRKLQINNKIMYDLFKDQTNLMHVIVGGKRKSLKLEYPKEIAEFGF